MFRRFALACLATLSATLSLAQLPRDARELQEDAMTRLKAEVSDVRFYKDSDRISRVYGTTVARGSSPIDAATEFVSTYEGLFAIGAGDLAVSGTQDVMRGKFTAVYFDEQLHGIPVDQSHLTVLVRNEPGNPVVLVSSATQHVSSISTTPAIGARQAVSAVKTAYPQLVDFSTPSLVVYRGETETLLAWSFYADKATLIKPERYLVFVSATTGAILELRDKIYHVDVNGQVQGFASPGLLPDHAGNPPQVMNLAGLRVAITGGNVAFTQPNGSFVIPNAGSSPVTVTADLRGQWVRVVPQQGSALALSQTVTPPGPANFVFNSAPTQFNTAQVNGFIHTEIIHNFAKEINPTYPGIDIQLPCNVNLNDTCNAYYNGSSINFFAAGGGCPNTCFSTVVYHEYGHFIIDRGHPQATGDYHEGMADVTAALAANSPCLGEDFRGINTGCLRSCYNNVVHPCGGESHLCGQVISGAFWLTKDELDTTVGPAMALQLSRDWYLNSILLHPSDINPGVTIDVLTLDDNDANLNNGTPHYTEIATGFGAKNLPAPPIDWILIEPLTVPGEFRTWVTGTPRVLVRMSVEDGAGVVDQEEVLFHYRWNMGAWQSKPLNPQRTGPYVGLMDQPPCGTSVQWYITAKDTQGHEVSYPAEGQVAPRFTVFGTGLATTFEDTFAANLGWTVSNTGLSAGAWTRANPNGTSLNGEPANPEDDSDDAGSLCFFTGQGSAGGQVGAADVDGGPTRLTSPVFNLTGENYIIEYKRWFFNDDGDDVFVAEISNDNGVNWTQIESFVFTGSENQWVRKSFALRNLINPSGQVLLRFRTSDNPNNSITEAAVDYVFIREVLCP